jgi:hypothetical protein
MKKTAVDWLLDILITENEITLKGENYKLFEIAKQMEKEQIIDAYDKGEFNQGCNGDAEQYYNETFNNKA